MSNMPTPARAKYAHMPAAPTRLIIFRLHYLLGIILAWLLIVALGGHTPMYLPLPTIDDQQKSHPNPVKLPATQANQRDMPVKVSFVSHIEVLILFQGSINVWYDKCPFCQIKLPSCAAKEASRRRRFESTTRRLEATYCRLTTNNSIWVSMVPGRWVAR